MADNIKETITANNEGYSNIMENETMYSSTGLSPRAPSPSTITTEPSSNNIDIDSTKNTRRGSVSAALKVDLQTEEELLTQWVIELLNTVTEILSIIPRGFFLVCEEMDDLIPRTFIPVRSSVPVHMIVTALYMLLNLGKGIINCILEEERPVSATTTTKHEFQTPKTNKGNHSKSVEADKGQPTSVHTVSDRLDLCLLSVAERLCYLDDPVFDQIIHRLITQIESM
jgi:hypothetical protein